MSNISDEKLMAYVDDELKPAERAEIEAAMAKDATILERMSVFRETREQLMGLYDQPLHQPVPDHLIELILSGGDDGTKSRRAASKRPAKNRMADSLKNWLPVWNGGYSTAIAYGLVLMAAGFAGWYLKSVDINQVEGGNMLVKYEHGQLLAQGRLNLALDSIQSGQKLVWSHDANADTWVRPVFTFRTPSRSYCRQYEIALATGNGFSGVACRGKNGRWQIKAHSVASPGPKTSNKTEPAAGLGSTMIDKVVDQMIDGDVLGVKEEAIIIGRKWEGTQ